MITYLFDDATGEPNTEIVAENRADAREQAYNLVSDSLTREEFEMYMSGGVYHLLPATRSDMIKDQEQRGF